MGMQETSSTDASHTIFGEIVGFQRSVSVFASDSKFPITIYFSPPSATNVPVTKVQFKVSVIMFAFGLRTYGVKYVRGTWPYLIVSRLLSPK